VSDAGVANLTFCDEIERVNLMGTPTGDGAVNALRGKGWLHTFHAGKRVTDRRIALLQDFPVFTTSRPPEFSYDLMSFGAGVNDLLLDGRFALAGLPNLIFRRCCARRRRRSARPGSRGEGHPAFL
jgi:hypothetical protein